MLGREPEEIAKFLAKTAGLNKTMIGEYLGEREDFCIKVMHAYVDALDFTGKDFNIALRRAPLWSLSSTLVSKARGWLGVLSAG